jgi:uncharacterized protein DUF6941
MLLADAAEVHDGLVSMIRGGWDTVTTSGPPPEPGVAAAIRGAMVIRVLLTREETGTPHAFTLRVVDEDGATLHSMEGDFTVDLSDDLPDGWEQAVTTVFDLGGLTLPRAGVYEAAFSVDGAFLRSVPFRVVEA